MHDLPRVLFATGLETGARDAKAGVLAASFRHVCVPDMRTGVFRVWRRNSIFRRALAPTSAPHAARLLALVLALLVAVAPRVPSRARALAGLAASATLPGLAREGLASSFAASVEAQRSALRMFAPDVAVGSSWGGAALLALREAGEWTGPLVLVAPARELVRRCGPARFRAPAHVDVGRAPSRTARAAVGATGARGAVVIVHADDDPIVPLSDSRELCRWNRGFRLLLVPNGGHRCARALEPPGKDGRPLLAALVSELHQRRVRVTI
ncbi:hypothetical protein KFE25_011967 [Diacronema lutheri]|uniref:Alpha/beta hydrolase n=2 Tax=Diacronema lutheri TaxID=2081491 RepID=A0A8J5X0U8_DIALT|nr:hypothetical protein KFE25_011967 [Diacronema lutheri]